MPGAIGWNWQTPLQDTLRRNLATKEEFERLAGQAEISNDSKVVLYGDNNNWFATWALWQFKYYGHQDVQLMNSGRKKWIEGKRPLSTDKPKLTPTIHKAKEPDNPIRAFRNEIFVLLDKKSHNLMDVRSPDEFTGKIIAPPGMPETTQRAGHIPGAKNIPWSKAVNEDGTFKSAEELKKL